MAVLSGAVALAALAPAAPHAGTALVPIYAFSVCCAGVLLGFTRHPWAALWCALAPLGLLAYFAVWGFHPRLEFADKALLVILASGWLAYSPRLIAVTRRWQSSDATPGASR